MGDGRPGAMSNLQNKLFQWTGLNWFTEAGKAGQAMWFANRMGKFSGTSFIDLDANTKAILDYHGISAAKWDVMRKMIETAEDGRVYLVPKQAANLTDADLAPLLPEWAKNSSDAVKAREMQKLRNELQTDAAGMIADETHFGVLEPDARTRAMLFQGTRPGTPVEEIWRAIWQFKSFPIAYLQRVIEGRRLVS